MIPSGPEFKSGIWVDSRDRCQSQSVGSKTVFFGSLLKSGFGDSEGSIF